ncbi:MAG: bacterioferritin [Planctomycetes bacterium]|nr:bacterioferritin [Planctomycetota bacterium]
MELAPKEKKKLIEALNHDLEHEMAGMIRYLHHSFMVFGVGRVPLVQVLREQVRDSMNHATMLGEKITALGGYPTATVHEEFVPTTRSIAEILRDSLAHEKEALAGYEDQLPLAGKNLALREMFKHIILEEQTHIEELEKLLRTE